jgi:hypothetical protein
MQLDLFRDSENIRLAKNALNPTHKGNLENIRFFQDAPAAVTASENNQIQKALSAPIARKTDPKTSHLSAQAITESGRRQGQLQGVLALLRKYPRSTSLELYSKSAFADRYICARRLPELERAGLAMKCGERLCNVGNRMATIWQAVNTR